MDPVDYIDTFIAVAEDSEATRGTVPPSTAGGPSVAARAFQMIAEHPYRFTSGDVIFTVFADRRAIPAQDRSAARQEFYSRGQPCLRSSDLGKRYGWGIHADGEGRIALVGVETPEYAEFLSASGAALRGCRSRSSGQCADPARPVDQLVDAPYCSSKRRRLTASYARLQTEVHNGPAADSSPSPQ